MGTKEIPDEENKDHFFLTTTKFLVLNHLPSDQSFTQDSFCI
jgi:hypothetical protein